MTKSFKIKPLLIDSQPESGAWFLFDWKTALRRKSLIISKFLFAVKLLDGFYENQLFPFWKHMKQKQGFTLYVQKMHVLISIIETTETDYE